MQHMDYYTVNDIGGYLGVRLRGGKILAVAHTDHLGTGKVTVEKNGTVVSSALDDRLGVYAALECLPTMGVECDVLLCDDEESANSSMNGVGMGFLAKYNWIIELDCSGVRAVTYDFDSMLGVLPTVWDDVSRGAFSDITSIEHVSPVGAFNAGVGYHMQHTERCHVKMPEFMTAMGRIKRFYDMYQDVRFEEKQAQENREMGMVAENKVSFYKYNAQDRDDDKRTAAAYLDEVANYSSYPDDDPADQYINSPRGRCLLDGDQAPIERDGHSELDICEMCSAILMNDEVYMYQGWPVCQEHYHMLVADDVDEDGNMVPNSDEWETSDG